VELAGGPTVDRPWVVIDGGPMMGRVVTDLDEPITKKTSGLIVLPADHPAVLQKTRAMDREVLLARAVCCQCRMCTDLCPRANLGHAIQPHLAMRSLGTAGVGETPPEHITAAFLCCLCGVCEVYACPMGLSPRKVFDKMRIELIAAGQSNPHRREDPQPHDFIEMRRVPLPRLVARLGLTQQMAAADRVDWRRPDVPYVRILLSQHTGAPAQPVVSVGQTVREGELIAEIPQDKLGARQHASIGGRVAKVDEHEIRIERA
jgi:Na+-translocating ferredoxin:NAD+ oxidoreductase RnfC subunit